MLFAFSHALRTVAFPHACVAPASLAASLISQFFHTFYGGSPSVLLTLLLPCSET